MFIPSLPLLGLCVVGRSHGCGQSGPLSCSDTPETVLATPPPAQELPQSFLAESESEGSHQASLVWSSAPCVVVSVPLPCHRRQATSLPQGLVAHNRRSLGCILVTERWPRISPTPLTPKPKQLQRQHVPMVRPPLNMSCSIGSGGSL